MIHLWAENNSKHGVGDYCRPFGLVLQLLVTWIKRTHLTRLLTPHFKVQSLFRVAGQSRNNISFKFWHSLFLKKEKKKGGNFMIIPYKMTCFYPCHILPWYVSISILAFFCPPFLLLAGKDRRHETFPHFFFIFDKACEDDSERGGVPFFCNRQLTKYNSFSAPQRSPFPQRPK